MVAGVCEKVQLWQRCVKGYICGEGVLKGTVVTEVCRKYSDGRCVQRSTVVAEVCMRGAMVAEVCERGTVVQRSATGVL